MTYEPFNFCIFRTPLYCIRDYNSSRIINDPIFNEALRLASPSFYEEKEKAYKEGNLSQKMIESIMKYQTRASTRCTPFGLFAGCSVVKIENVTNILFDTVTKNKRITRLDMNYICALVQYLENLDEIKSQLLYYPNNSIYEQGQRI